jgi:transcriptional regulator with XRE-family HTH domain
MVLDSIRNLIADKEPTPNKFTKAMGELIRKARDEAGLSQAELAQKIYRRRATVSDMENGKVEVSSTVLPLLAAALDKPLTYFYPPQLFRELKPEKFTPLEHELLLQFRNIWNEYLQRIAIDQVRVLAEFDPEEMIWELVDIVVSKKERDELIEKYISEKKKGRKSVISDES